MENLIVFFRQNYHWIFSGIGAAIIIGLIKFILNKNKTQYQKIGKNSKGIQVGGNYTVNIEKRESKKDARGD